MSQEGRRGKKGGGAGTQNVSSAYFCNQSVTERTPVSLMVNVTVKILNAIKNQLEFVNILLSEDL